MAAQIPTVCANNADLQCKVCCPNDCGGSDRGTCVNVSTMRNTDYSITELPTCFTNDGLKIQLAFTNLHSCLSV